MDELREHIARIQAAANALSLMYVTDIALDAALGTVEYEVHSARQQISDEWSVARTTHLRKRTTTEPSTLESLA